MTGRRTGSRLSAATLVGTFFAALSGVVLPDSVLAATTFVVNRTGDGGDINLGDNKCDTSTASGRQCTLRAAIQQANSTAGADTITFAISSTSKVIAPASPLPPITDQLEINGYSQAGASQNTQTTGNNAVLKVVVDGINAGAGANGLELGFTGTLVRGLVIQRFDAAGIFITASKVTVEGNFIGTNAAGNAKRGNGIGVRATNNQASIGRTFPASRNVISGNDAEGVLVEGADSSFNIVVGNYIGTTKNGAAALGNGGNGLTISYATETRVGSGGPGGGNVISGNAAHGVEVRRGDTGNNTIIAGNLIGTNAAGSGDLGNGFDGVFINVDDVTVGGSTAQARNVISGNHGSGVFLFGPRRAHVFGNYIGLNAAGTAAVGNDGSGVQVMGGGNHSIGSSTPGERNVISGNGSSGIRIAANDVANVIRNNLIGTKADGTGDLGNGGSGVNLVGAVSNSIGGSGAGEGNVLAGNGSDGVTLAGPSTNNNIIGNSIAGNDGDGIKAQRGPNTIGGNVIVGNHARGVRVTAAGTGVEITGNQIFANDQLEIDLAGGTENGLFVTANDQDDPDVNANDLQNFPVLTSATRSGTTGVTTIAGSLNSNPSTSFRIELFLVVADGSAHGGGQAMLATQTITTNSGGDKSFNFQLGTLAPGQAVTVTATATASGNTSEFSTNVTVLSIP